MTERTDAELERKPRLEWRLNMLLSANAGPLRANTWPVINFGGPDKWDWNVIVREDRVAIGQADSKLSAQLAAEDALAQIADNINNALGRGREQVDG